MSVRLLGTELRRFFARRAITFGLLASMLLALGINLALVVHSRIDPATGRDTRINIARTFAETVRGVGLTLTLLAAFLAATYIAADFGTSLSTQLLFEPRRRRVYFTKTVAAAIGCGAVAAVVLVWCGLLQYGGASLRGITTGVDASWVAHRLGDIGRAASASALMGVISFAIAAATRKTAAAVGTLFGLFVAMEFLRGPHWAHIYGRLIPVNAIWGIAVGFAGALPDFLVELHTMPGALLIGGAWAVAVTIVGAELFARREVR
jgi:hypothetical protein